MLFAASLIALLSTRLPRLYRLGCAALLMMVVYPARSTGSVTISIGGGSWYAQSSYWAELWEIKAWPIPSFSFYQEKSAPFSRLAIAPLIHAPTARHLGAIPGEFVLLDAEGRLHRASAQYLDTWHALGAAPVRAGAEGFSFDDSLLLLTDQGFEQRDPGSDLLLEPEEETAAVLAAHPLRFAPHAWAAVRPGTTYAKKDGRLVKRPNTGLILPPGDADNDSPPRPHSLGKIVPSGGWFYVLGELNENTPGHPPGTQVLFRSVDGGITWHFEPLPRLAGRWRDVAVASDRGDQIRLSPLSGQIVIVGDDGIYTCLRDGHPWLHIQNNLTTATPELHVTFPQGAQAPINEALPLRLRSIAWLGNRFVAAGFTKDGNGTPVFIEGVSRYWFAYPLEGWPQARAVDQIVASTGRLLLLSHADGPERPVFLASDTPITLATSKGLPPILPSFLKAFPTLGSATPVTLHNPVPTAVRRYIIEGESSAGWSLSDGRLYPPRVPVLGGKRLLDETPLRFTITAINEFGRSAPATVEITPQRPPLPFAEPEAPKLQLPKTVRLVYGAPVNIPVKAAKNIWAPDLVWAYGLPEGLVFDRRAQAIVGHALNPGSYHVQLLAFRDLYYYSDQAAGIRASFSAPLRIEIGTPSPKPIDTGTFTGLLDGAEALAGRWTVTLQTNRTFTGKLVLAGTSHSFRGTLTAEPATEGVFASTVVINRGKKLSPLTLDLVLQAPDGRLGLFVDDGVQEASTAGGSVAHIPWAKDRHSPRTGRYMAAIRLETDDVAPVGTGFVRINVGATGQVSLVGELANGLKWTDSTPLAADGAIPVRWQSSGGRALRGVLAFDPDSPLSTAIRGSLAWRTGKDEKCPVYGRAASLAMRGDRAPVWEKYRALPPSLFGGEFSLIARHEDLSRFGTVTDELSTPFHAYSSQPKVAEYSGQTNPSKLTLHTDGATCLMTGGFTLVEPVGPKSLKRQVTLRGAIITDPDTGQTTSEGYFLFSVNGESAQRSGYFFAPPKLN